MKYMVSVCIYGICPGSSLRSFVVLQKNDFCLLSWRNMWTQEFGTSLCALVKFTQENVVIYVIYRFHGRKDFPSFTWMETLHLNSHPRGRLKQITRGRATIHELVLLVDQNLKKIRGREGSFSPSVSIVEYAGGEPQEKRWNTLDLPKNKKKKNREKKAVFTHFLGEQKYKDTNFKGFFLFFLKGRCFQ